MMQKVGETEYRQVNIQYGMIFMLGGLWAAVSVNMHHENSL
jgi:hypothetical protein